MIIGETLLSENSTDGDTYFTPWFPTGGNLAALTCEVIAVAGASKIDSFKVQVQTKNKEDADKDAVDLLGTAQSITLTAGAYTKFNAGASLDSTTDAGFLELVRFMYIPKADAGKLAWVHYRMLPPSWLTN